jgi:membrane protein implicated in regulation of membrane protease activity
MSVPTVQFLIFLFIAACTALIIWGAMRNRAREQAEIERQQSNRRVQREIDQIEMHRPHHFIKGEGNE